MKSKLLSDERQSTFALVFDKDDEFTSTLLEFAKQHTFIAGHFNGIGAFKDVTIGFFEREQKDYRRIEINEQVEVMSVTGTIATSDSGPKIHAHVVIGKRDGSAHGGHLLQAHVWPTLELILTKFPSELRRVRDDETNLSLLSV